MADEASSAEDMDEDAPGDAKNDALFRRLQAWFRADRSNWTKWRKEAQEDFEFYSGEQWSDDDRRVLDSKGRPVIVFNRVAPLVNAVVGAEVNNRREVRYIPREEGDAIANEMLTSAADWFRDQTDGEDEDSSAFQDAVICGLGWTENRLDFDDEPDGAPSISRIDPFEMLYDHRAVKSNLVDAKRVWRVRDMELDAARELFGKLPITKLHAGWAMTSEKTEPHDQNKSDFYESEDNPGEGASKTVRIVECQWIEFDEFWRVPEGPEGKIVDKTPEQKKALDKIAKEAGQKAWPGDQARRKKVCRAFIGAEILKDPDSLISYKQILHNYTKKTNNYIHNNKKQNNKLNNSKLIYKKNNSKWNNLK